MMRHYEKGAFSSEENETMPENARRTSGMTTTKALFYAEDCIRRAQHQLNGGPCPWAIESNLLLAFRFFEMAGAPRKKSDD